MKKQRLPQGWTEKRIRELAAHHDNQTEEEQAAEIEAALSAEDQTIMVVPTKLVPQIQALIVRKRAAPGNGSGVSEASRLPKITRRLHP